MNLSHKFRGGTFIVFIEDDVGLSWFFLKERCKMNDILGLCYKAPTIWRNGNIEVITKRTMAIMRENHKAKPTPYTFVFLPSQTATALPFYNAFLSEVRRYKGSEGAFADGWWTWPEEDAHAPEPAEPPAAQPEAEVPAQVSPPVEPQPAQPTAAAESDLEQAIQDKVAEEKKQKGPACPDCGCTSIFADKDETGAVVITCLNCGRQWHPGEHRSW